MYRMIKAADSSDMIKTVAANLKFDAYIGIGDVELPYIAIKQDGSSVRLYENEVVADIMNAYGLITDGGDEFDTQFELIETFCFECLESNGILYSIEDIVENVSLADGYYRFPMSCDVTVGWVPDTDYVSAEKYDLSTHGKKRTTEEELESVLEKYGGLKLQ